MSDKTGGQAFPTQVECDEKYMDAGGYGRVRRVRKDIPGMTLRDYFAVRAEGLPDEPDPEWVEGITGLKRPSGTADYAEWNMWWMRVDALMKYKRADAMLWARGRREEGDHE